MTGRNRAGYSSGSSSGSPGNKVTGVSESSVVVVVEYSYEVVVVVEEDDVVEYVVRG